MMQFEVWFGGWLLTFMDRHQCASEGAWVSYRLSQSPNTTV